MTDGLARLSEVAAVLTAHGRLACTPRVEEDEGCISLHVTVHCVGQDGLHEAMESLELFHELRHVIDMAQLRGLAEKYNIDPAALEALLPERP